MLLTCGILAIASRARAGTIVVTTTASIAEGARAKDPNDPLDGVAFIGVGYLFAYTAVGMLAGGAAALLVAITAFLARDHVR